MSIGNGVPLKSKFGLSLSTPHLIYPVSRVANTSKIIRESPILLVFFVIKRNANTVRTKGLERISNIHFCNYVTLINVIFNFSQYCLVNYVKYPITLTLFITESKRTVWGMKTKSSF